MMRSMFSGVSGLRVHQTKMDVIANNISNVNTVGFKSSRVTFSEIFAQTVNGASAANDATGRGGVNPMQIGLGASVASIDLSMTTGAAQRTDNPYDLMIQGDGFFIVGDNSGKYFTRAGAFTLDEAGNLVNPSGLKVYGWDRTWDKDNATWKVEKGAVKEISITGAKRNAPPATTTKIEFEGNLNSLEEKEHTMNVAFYDSLGNRFVGNVTFTYESTASGQTTWKYKFGDSVYSDLDSETKYKIEFSPADGTVVFDDKGNIVKVNTNADNVFSVSTTLKIDAGTSLPASNMTTNPTALTFDFSGLTQFNEEVSAQSNTVDGHEPGTLKAITIGTEGKVMGSYTNGDLILLAQIAVARFRNPAGLEKVGDNLYVPSPNSGDFNGVGEDVQESGGKIMGGVLEMSNVDLSQEFTEMITTQRGFQANSRIITTSDDMLQELVNLKR